ncbi:TPA: hypothetical protein RQN15_003259 [Aeromonas hydrophila]|nr:hypothetical protein [Aeromonas hydrophila]
MKKARQRARFLCMPFIGNLPATAILLSMGFWTRVSGHRGETRVPNNSHKKTDAWASVFYYPVC